MKGAVLCQHGVEDLAAAEVKTLIGQQGKTGPGYVSFEIDDVKELFVLCYRAQLIWKVLLMTHEGKVKDIEDLKSQLAGAEIPGAIQVKESFAVRRLTDWDDDQEMNGVVGEAIFSGTPVNLDNPHVTFFVHIKKGQYIAGVDFSGVDVSKRDYRIYQTRDGLKATTCKAVLDIGGYTKDTVLCIPFSGDGLFGIEAACLASGKSIHYYHKDKFLFFRMFSLTSAVFEDIDNAIVEDVLNVSLYDESFKHVDFCKKNAKIAGVHKLIGFSRLAVEWLDTKFDKETVDLIVCYPPQLSKIIPDTKILPQYRELFYQAKFVLNAKGKLVALMRKKGSLTEYATQQGFELKHSREIEQGRSILYVEVFGV